VARDESEYTTDLQKCIEEIDERAGEEASATIVILGGLSGRLDQTTHVLALLQKLRRGNGSNNHRDTEASTSAWQGSDFKVFMGQELVSNSRGEDLYQDFAKGNGTKDIRVISENCVAWVLDVASRLEQEDRSSSFLRLSPDHRRESIPSVSTTKPTGRLVGFFRSGSNPAM
jgi:hypothetical protein